MYPNMAEKGYAKLDSIVTVVDALRIRDEFGLGEDLLKKDIGEEDLASLVIQQIEFCNIIVLNKVDEVSAEELEKVKLVIRKIQPKAQIMECNYGDIELSKILNTDMFDFDKVATSAAWIAAMEEDDDEEEEHEHQHEHEHEEHEHHHHHHHHGLENEESGEALEYGIGTFVYKARRPLDLSLFDEFVARKWPKSVIRCKGICYFQDERDTCYVFEQAGKQMNIRNAGQWYATMPKDELEAFKQKNPGLQRDWDDTYGDRMQKLVFIGKDMDRDEICKQLDGCLC